MTIEKDDDSLGTFRPNTKTTSINSELVNNIVNFIEKGRSCWIVGLNRMGKTTLLKDAAKQLKEAEANYEVITIEGNLSNKELSDISSKLDVMNQDKVNILCIDEIHTILDHKYLSEKILNYKCLFIATSFYRKEYLVSKSKDINLKKLNNIFLGEIVIEPWNENKVSSYLKTELKNKDIVDDVIKSILNMTHGIPYFIVELVEALKNKKENGKNKKINVIDIEQCVRDTLSKNTAIFSNFFKQMPEPYQRIFLIKTLKVKFSKFLNDNWIWGKPKSKLDNILDSLKKEKYIDINDFSDCLFEFEKESLITLLIENFVLSQKEIKLIDNILNEIQQREEDIKKADYFMLIHHLSLIKVPFKRNSYVKDIISIIVTFIISIILCYAIFYVVFEFIIKLIASIIN